MIKKIMNKYEDYPNSVTFLYSLYFIKVELIIPKKQNTKGYFLLVYRIIL